MRLLWFPISVAASAQVEVRVHLYNSAKLSQPHAIARELSTTTLLSTEKPLARARGSELQAPKDIENAQKTLKAKPLSVRFASSNRSEL